MIIEYPSLNASYIYSQKYIQHLTHEIGTKINGPSDFICVLVVGSYGRGEAVEGVSDFEWITIYDDTLVGVEEARRFQADLTGYFANIFGRHSLSINKTFGEICSISDLCSNVGGEADTNRMLTYRMLVLAEGTTITNNTAYKKIIDSIAESYGSSFTAGHRLLSLATDISRYYRTMRIDFKFKVDEGKKSWALRSMKLRSTRRMWYLASAMHFIAFGPRIDYSITQHFDLKDVRAFMLDMGGNVTIRLLKSAKQLNADPIIIEEILSMYDAIHNELSDRSLREYLDRLDGNYKFNDERYEAVHLKCRALHTAAADLIASLDEEPRRQIIEMFLL